jgi:ubiquinone/menaquinone biosynthesis C-methylase UbiE
MATPSPQLDAVLGKVISDLGATANAALVIVGDRLGLYTALADLGPCTADELAARTNCHPRSVREWLSAQAASGYVTYDTATRQFSLSPEQAMVFADADSPAYMTGGFYSAAAAIMSERKLTEAFRQGNGIPWGDHHECLFCGVERFFRTGYNHHLTQEWLPALTGVTDKLRAGAQVADIGCGHGASTIVMAAEYPHSRFVGFDYHPPSIERARQIAAQRGLTNVQFEVASAQDFPKMADQAYDLVTTFDALHDMGDPRGAARQVYQNLKPDGAWMVVEPAAGDRLEDNLNPVGRVYYSMSASVCVPSAMSQPGGEALGAQAGPAKLNETITSGGFTQFRVATQTPFNLVCEARP